jgi:putative ABC transport system permease protein
VKYAKPDQQTAFFNDVLERVSALPGVRSAAITAATPLTIKRITPMLPEGQAEVPLGERPFLAIEAVSPRWFEAMHVPVRAGRVFTQADDAHAPRVAIVNASFARQFWPGQSATGRHIVIGRGPAATEVVGVSADVKNSGLEKAAEAQVYVPFQQLPWSDMNLLVRTSQEPQMAVAPISAAIHAVDSEQPITDVRTADELLDTSRAQPRFATLLVVVFAAAALALAVTGIYGVLSFAVAQRRQEFGIRMALGAVRGDILRLVMGRGLALTLGGIAAGLVAALVVTRLAAGMLYEVSARDAVSFVVAPVVLLLVALLASALAARRATNVDPIEAMR